MYEENRESFIVYCFGLWISSGIARPIASSVGFDSVAYVGQQNYKRSRAGANFAWNKSRRVVDAGGMAFTAMLWGN